ncbi:discoidin domain-containing protein [Luteimonas saliphila]|uniref:discoidin domain-containing protein n=1 Tax=Luteimonas saliphila TaxID=2804919 RepID=UPI00192E1CD8|nr:discoidin domain-containing protein [Luteimonas saliphila]
MKPESILRTGIGGALATLLWIGIPVAAWCGLPDAGLPRREGWSASASSTQVDALRAAHAIDGDPATRWGGDFSAGHWLQVDLGRAAEVAGVLIHWDSGFAVSWTIQASIDGRAWDVVYTSRDSRGGHDYVFFPAAEARYLRLASLPHTADWGVSVFEFTPLSTRDAARISGVASADGRGLFDGEGRYPEEMVAAGAGRGTRGIEVALPPGIEIAGLEVWWDGPRNGAVLEVRTANGWQRVAEDPGTLGGTSFLSARAPLRTDAMRLLSGEVSGRAPRIGRLRLLGPREVMTPMRRYEIVAARAHRDLFPPSLHGEQVYWTTVGVPAGRQKSLFDEFGNLEAYRGAPMVQALWRDDEHGAATSAQVERRHALRDGWIPCPSVEWSPREGLSVRSEALAYRQDDQPITLLRHTLRNAGTRDVRGDLSLLVRPLQVNPPWQHGGVSRIEHIVVGPEPAGMAVRVNGRRLFTSLTPPAAQGVAGFGRHGEGEPTSKAAAGVVPDARGARDPDGLATAVLRYPVSLAPGEQAQVVVAFALGDAAMDAAGALPEAPPVDVEALLAGHADPGAAFDAMAALVAEEWRSKFASFDLRLPDASIVDGLRAQAASMMINQTGHAIQPGPRNYNRSFIRDGQATASILVRMGQPAVAREYLRWYTDHALNPNGLVSPILDEDGSINRGFGSDIEHDSQGQYILLVADIARYDGGPESVRQYLPAVKQAMRFMQTLRDRTMVPGYMAAQPAPGRFRGLIAPSISHEGYSTPTHSYWDDYFAIKGWDDGAWLAGALGDEATAAWAREQGAALRRSVSASIRATIAWKGSDTIPASADLGESDPTSVSIALDPAGARDVLPERQLLNTYDRYMVDVRRRDVPGALYAYTPYELRNVLTYVHLGRPADARELLDRFVAQQRPRAWRMWPEVVHSRERHPGYIGDMPHTWIGSEYVRAVLGMIVQEAPGRLVLLPGAPADWLAGDGLASHGMPTAFGRMDLHARLVDDRLRVELSGVKGVGVEVHWPPDMGPPRVLRVDGRAVEVPGATPFASLPEPFRVLEAAW